LDSIFIECLSSGVAALAAIEYRVFTAKKKQPFIDVTEGRIP
jgi:hypothetical protein